MPKRRLLSLLLLIFSVVFYPLLSNAENHDRATAATDSLHLAVRTEQGWVRGILEENIRVWRGIPYAQAPIDSLRFRKPQKMKKWEGMRAAAEYGYSALQYQNNFTKGQKLSEDCLYLNVWSPAATDTKKRPVMVWIHGGGFEVGSGSSPLYDGSSLAATGNVVVVTLNYRMGVFGFLYFGTEHAGFDNNLGICDQIAALQWVHENIAAFGGDPNNITIFGESAGGTSVEILLISPVAKGLFHKAIVESGPPTILWEPSMADSVRTQFMKLLHLPADSFQFLKTIAADTLLAAQRKLSKFLLRHSVNKVYSPTIDGELIKAPLSSGLTHAQSGNIPLLIGTNKDEATLFTGRWKMMPDNQEDLDRELLHRMTTEEARRITEAYPGFPKKRAISDILSDAIFRIPAIRYAERQSRFAPVYMYRFEWSPAILNMSGLRTFHGLEMPFVFGNIDGRAGRLLRSIGSIKVIRKLSAQMQQAWINFARYGNPNGAEGGIWKNYDLKNRTTMIFDKESKPVNDPDSEQRRVWDGVSYY